MIRLERIKKFYELSLSHGLGIIPIHYEKQWQTVRGGYRTLYTGRCSAYLAYYYPKNAHYYDTDLTGVTYLQKGYNEDEYVKYRTTTIYSLLKELSKEGDWGILIYDELNCQLEDIGFEKFKDADINDNKIQSRFKTIIDRYFLNYDISKIYIKGNSKVRYVFRLRKYNQLEKEDIMTDFKSEYGNERLFNFYKRTCFDSLSVWIDFSIYLNFSSSHYGEINLHRICDKIEDKIEKEEDSYTELNSFLQTEPEIINSKTIVEPIGAGYRDYFYYDTNRFILPLGLYEELSTLIKQKKAIAKQKEWLARQELERQRMLAKQDFNLRNRHTRDTYIHFDNSLHTYTYQLQKLKPVTKILEQFFPQFDTNYWAQIKATQLGMSVNDVIAMWKAKGEEAAKKGTLLHQRIDDFLHNKEVTTNDEDFKLFKIFYSSCSLNPFRTEWTIYDENSGIAGTVDLLDYTNGKYTIYDWKRSNKIVKNCEVVKNYGREMGFAPIDDLENTAYWHYTLQLSFYRYILETKYNIEVSDNKLIILHPENQLPYVLSVPYMKTHILRMIQSLNK